MQFLIDHEACGRLGLRHGQFFAYFKHKNLHWELNGKIIGYGDLRNEDIARIAEVLTEGEEFKGYNEHHMSRTMQRENEVVYIAKDTIDFPPGEEVKSETRRQIYLEWSR